jgi:hypothetical protein
MTKENKPKNGFFNNFLEYGGCLTVLIIAISIGYIAVSFLEELAIAVLGEKTINKIGDFFQVLVIGYIAYNYFNYFNAQFQSLNQQIEYLQKTVNSLKETIKELKRKND